MGVFYATDLDVKLAGDIGGADMDAQIRRALESASRSIDGTRAGGGRLHRRFYPEVATRYFSKPAGDPDPAYRLNLGRYEIISATAVVSGGTTITAGTQYTLGPRNDGPPYSRIDLVTSALAAWPSGAAQDGIAVTGVWGYRADEAPAGTAAGAIASTSVTTFPISDSSMIGVGTILRVDGERVIVTGRALLTTGQTNLTPLTAFMDDQVISVTSGAAFTAGEMITLDAETMLINAIAGNTLIVRRAFDGSTLDTHTGATIYAPRTLTVERGALGTSPATHLTAAPLFRHVVPPLVASLCVAEVLDQVAQDGSAWAGQTNAGDTASVAVGVGLADIRASAERAYARQTTWLGV
jgi:hypothetical protein